MARSVFGWVILIILLTLAHCDDKPRNAKVKLTSQSGKKSGELKFTQKAKGEEVHIEGKLDLGFTEGDHGFHVHEKGVNAEGAECKDAGGHFNPDPKKNHGGPTDTERHVGDLGNIKFDANGVADVNIKDKGISLFEGNNSIIGKSIVIHEGPDDLGKGTSSDSKTTGHAGGRLTCGVITLIPEEAAGSKAVSIQMLKTTKTILLFVSGIAIVIMGF